jgi:hypothetical protein
MNRVLLSESIVVKRSAVNRVAKTTSDLDMSSSNSRVHSLFSTLFSRLRETSLIFIAVQHLQPWCPHSLACSS